MVIATLLLIAVIWGFGFVPQKFGLDYFDPAAFNAWRFGLGALTVVPVVVFAHSAKGRLSRDGLYLGVALGALLFGGAFLQQVSLIYTSVANVSFITGLYVIIVPVLGLILGYRYRLVVWMGGITAVFGLYLLTRGGREVSLTGDLIALAGAVFWACHLLLLAQKAGKHNQIQLAFLQFAFCAVFSGFYAIGFEERLFAQSVEGWQWPLLNGVVVVGVAYTLQVMVMDKADPFLASVILSLEAVFGAVAAYFVFDESLTAAAMVGAVLMLIGCVLAQSKEGAIETRLQ